MTKTVVREDLQRAVSESQVLELQKDVKDLIAKVATLEGRLDEKRRNEERSFNRKWQLVSVVLSAALTTVTAILLYLLGLRST